MRKFLLLVVLTIMLLSVFAYAGHTLPTGRSHTMHFCECSESEDDLCYDDSSGEPLPLCDSRR